MEYQAMEVCSECGALRNGFMAYCHKCGSMGTKIVGESLLVVPCGVCGKLLNKLVDDYCGYCGAKRA